REAAEREGGAPQRGVLLGQPGQFLATARTVISHTHSPFRSSRTFERDDIHTGHNECSRRTVRWPPDAPPRLIKPAMVSLPVEARRINTNAEVGFEECWGILQSVSEVCPRRAHSHVLSCHTLNTRCGANE